MPPALSLPSGTRRNWAYFRGKMTAQTLSLNPFKILHYDMRTGDLKIFWCPAYCGTSIDICNWDKYRKMHDFRYPCCFCPAEAPEDSMQYTECKVLLASKGSSSRRDTGKWIALCAERRCGYYVCLEDCYQAAGFQSKAYPLRMSPTTNSLLHIPLMRSADQPALDALLRLDSAFRPGLTIKQLFYLLTICRCGVIMTRNTFTRHYCKFIIVDLTVESDSEGKDDSDAAADSVMGSGELA
ncbi:hypothetical protein FIBSPDRAFT_955088 [Athelia psychrophila]|uniref:Uncharacterized protein n=1 Tax=Athelia psychrophila TaxID=1759441 RepID=A0A166IHA6_9AGAM|nr:hypothetical protein FIBSPDRAFT_955088 [Fibularhizoctonia sp. CBS 109695]